MGHALFRAVDREMMARCIELSRAAASEGEFPFASLVTFNDTIIAEATNQVARDSDITRHAELLAVSKSQKVLGRSKLNGCTLYTNVEPCPMCSFPIREARIRRVNGIHWARPHGPRDRARRFRRAPHEIPPCRDTPRACRQG